MKERERERREEKTKEREWERAADGRTGSRRLCERLRELRLTFGNSADVVLGGKKKKEKKRSRL